jgi:chromosome segregation ATPase
MMISNNVSPSQLKKTDHHNASFFSLLPVLFAFLAIAFIFSSFSGFWSSMVLSLTSMWTLSCFFGRAGLFTGCLAFAVCAACYGWDVFGNRPCLLFTAISIVSSFMLVCQREWSRDAFSLLEKEYGEEKERCRSLEDQIRDLQRAGIEQGREWAKQQERIIQEKENIQRQLASMDVQLREKQQELEKSALRHEEDKQSFEEEKQNLQASLAEMTGKLREVQKEKEKQDRAFLDEHALLNTECQQLKEGLEALKQAVQQKQSLIQEYEGLLAQKDAEIMNRKATEEERLLREQESTQEPNWRILHNELRKQFVEKSEILNQTRKELFFVDNQLQALERERILQTAEENQEQDLLIDLLMQAESENVELEKELQQLEQVVSVLTSDKKKTSTRMRKSKKEANQDEMQLDLGHVIAAKIKKNSKVHSTE